MNEVDLLIIISWVSLVVWVGCGLHATYYLGRANGHTPFVLMKLGLVSIGILWAVNKVILTYRITMVVGGPYHFAPYVDRLLLTALPIMLSIVLVWVMKRKIR